VCPGEDEAGNVFYTVFNFLYIGRPRTMEGQSSLCLFNYFGGAMYTGVGIIMARGREDP